MNVAIAILNWNGKTLLKEFLPAVLENSEGANVYVIDNGSTDDSVSWLEKSHPEVGIICLDENLGYAGGYNMGLRGIEEELLVLMNNDLQPDTGWLHPLISAFASRPELVAAQPKILDLRHEEYFEYAGAAGGFLDRLGYPFCRGRMFNTLEEDKGQYNTAIPIFWASGACLVVRKEAFDKAGGFDTDLFAHQEEIDLCWRLQQGGGEIWCYPDSRVYHLGGGTLNTMNPRKTYLNFRNSILLLIKHLRLIELLWVIPVRLALDLIAALYFTLKGQPGHGLAVLRAWLALFKYSGRFIRKRSSSDKRLHYWKIPSLVWAYYLLKKRTFNRL